MGGSSSTLDNKDTTVNPPSECPMHAQQQPTKKVDQNANYQSDCPMSQGENRACPVKHDGGDAIDPLNMMPPPNQRPSEGQPFPLPTGRVTSTIPKAGTEETWQYPSQQMFWNAMLRKGWRWKDEEITPGAMESIINIHNANNEQAWREVLKWEAMHACECSEPKLKKFGGKATQYSPRSRVRSWLGYELPFDRHDWIVDRCGRDVRYIIDYYNGGDVDEKSNEFTILDVRPAFDSFTAFKDRMKVHYMRWTAKNDDVIIGGTVVNHRKPSVAS